MRLNRDDSRRVLSQLQTLVATEEARPAREALARKVSEPRSRRARGSEDGLWLTGNVYLTQHGLVCAKDCEGVLRGSHRYGRAATPRPGGQPWGAWKLPRATART